MNPRKEPAAGAVIDIREATEADVPRILEIANALFPEYAETAEEFQAFQRRLRDGGYTSVRAVAVIASGEVVGHYHFHHMPGQFQPTRYRAVAFTDPAWQRRGVGSALYEHMLAELRRRGARAIETFARESMPDVVSFLERRGFAQIMRAWECRLDLRRFDPAPFAGYVESMPKDGIEITTLEEERQRDPGALRYVYELHNALVADIPMPVPFTPPSFEEYLASHVESPSALLDAYFLAKAGDRYVGEANLQRPGQGNHLNHNITGVLQAYRGRGIAMALKLATIAYAQARGYSEIRTWNEEHNTGILAINDRLGFVRQPAWLTFEKVLEGAPAR